MRVSVVRDGMGHLEPEWTALFARDPEASPFMSFEWLSAWWRHWSAANRPWIVTVHDGGRLVGLAPFVLRSRGPLRILDVMGGSVSNYWNVISAPEEREGVLALVMRELDRRAGEWDALSVERLPEEAGTEAALMGAGLRRTSRTRWPSPRIALPETFDEYLARLSKNRRGKIRRNLKSVDGGELTVRSVCTPAELRAAIPRWQALRVNWWAERERLMNPEHGSARFLAFAEEVILAMVPRGLAMVTEVRTREELVGFTVDFLDASTFYYWKWGFDPSFESLRPGHVLIAYHIRWSIQTGRSYYDFMLGDEPYKYDYAPEDRAVLSMKFGNRRLRSRAALGLSSLRRATASN